MSKPVDKHDATGSIITIPGVGIMLAWAATIPIDGGAGYGPSCLFLTTTTKKLYINTGTKASATWTVVGTQS